MKGRYKLIAELILLPQSFRLNLLYAKYQCLLPDREIRLADKTKTFTALFANDLILRGTYRKRRKTSSFMGKM